LASSICGGLNNRGKLPRPVVAVPRAEGDLAVTNVHLGAVPRLLITDEH
jgi:hypothetical protein